MTWNVTLFSDNDKISQLVYFLFNGHLYINAKVIAGKWFSLSINHLFKALLQPLIGTVTYLSSTMRARPVYIP